MARIFVVEDDASLREELMRLLELQGHTALTGTAFDRIVDDVLAAAPDCVILDLKLPGTGGHTVCRDLRRSSQVPVIMLTSSDSEFDEVLSMNLGADDYVRSLTTQPCFLRASNRFCAVRSVPSRRRVSSIEAWCWTWRAGGWSTADVPST